MTIENETLFTLVNIDEDPLARSGGKLGGGNIVVQNQAREIGKMGYPVSVVTNTEDAFVELDAGRLSPDVIYPPKVVRLPLKNDLATIRGNDILLDDRWRDTAETLIRGYLTDGEQKYAVPLSHMFVAGRLVGSVAEDIGKPLIYMPHSLQRIVHFYASVTFLCFSIT